MSNDLKQDEAKKPKMKLSNLDMSKAKDVLNKGLIIAKEHGPRVASKLGRATGETLVKIDDGMIRLGQMVSEKNEALRGFANAMIVYAIYSFLLETYYFIMLDGYGSRYLVSIIPILVFVGASVYRSLKEKNK